MLEFKVQATAGCYGDVLQQLLDHNLRGHQADQRRTAPWHCGQVRTLGVHRYIQQHACPLLRVLHQYECIGHAGLAGVYGMLGRAAAHLLRANVQTSGAEVVMDGFNELDDKTVFKVFVKQFANREVGRTVGPLGGNKGAQLGPLERRYKAKAAYAREFLGEVARRNSGAKLCAFDCWMGRIHAFESVQAIDRNAKTAVDFVGQPQRAELKFGLGIPVDVALAQQGSGTGERQAQQEQNGWQPGRLAPKPVVGTQP